MFMAERQTYLQEDGLIRYLNRNNRGALVHWIYVDICTDVDIKSFIKS
jgi:hypothetical protein